MHFSEACCACSHFSVANKKPSPEDLHITLRLRDSYGFRWCHVLQHGDVPWVLHSVPRWLSGAAGCMHISWSSLSHSALGLLCSNSDVLLQKPTVRRRGLAVGCGSRERSRRGHSSLASCGARVCCIWCSAVCCCAVILFIRCLEYSGSKTSDFDLFQLQESRGFRRKIKRLRRPIRS